MRKQNEFNYSRKRSFTPPIFGKRSVDSDMLSPLEKHHLNLHRTTRHNLYRRIAKFIDA